jgi:hypothetical protein
MVGEGDMAKILYGVLCRAVTESVPGTPEDMTPPGTFDATNAGLVQLAGDAGVLNSGVDASLEGEFQESAPSSLSEQAASLLRVKPQITLHLPIAGRRKVTPSSPFDLDFRVYPGVQALWEACGLIWSAWGGGIGQIVQLAAVKTATVDLMFAGGYHWTIGGCVGTPTLRWEAGGIGVLQIALEGSFDAAQSGAYAYPGTVNFEDQASVGGPVVSQVGHIWGAGPAARGFSTLEITVDNQVESAPDSNALNGEVSAQSRRIVNVSGTIYRATGDVDFELQQLLQSIAREQMTFAVGGPPSVNPERANAYTVSIPKLEARADAQAVIAANAAVQLTGKAVMNATPGDELQLIFS